MIKEYYKLVSNLPVWVKLEADVSSNTVSILHPDTIVMVDEKIGYWYKTNLGWVYTLNENGEEILVKQDGDKDFKIQLFAGEDAEIEAQEKAMLGNANEKATAQETKSDDKQGIKVDKDGNIDSTVNKKGILPEESLKMLNGYLDTLFGGKAEAASGPNQNSAERAIADQISTTLSFNNIKGIHGMPYQFLPNADRRLSGQSTSSSSNTFGRKYAEKIVARMPLLFMTPGVPDFLSKFDEATRKSVLENVISRMGVNEDNSKLEQLMKGEGRYYTFKPDMAGYFNHVNPILRVMAHLLGIQDKSYCGTRLDILDWSTVRNSTLSSTLTYRHANLFYIESETQIQEQMSNATTRSGLEAKANQLSDMAREIQFITGASNQTAALADSFNNNVLGKNQQNTSDIANKLSSEKNIFNSISSSLGTVFAGGKLIFPEIWSDSDFSRSYSINMKLVSPDNDPYSWFLNIGVPIGHLIGHILPRQSGPNGYMAPYLVRGYYKGMFNCDMGIITDMSLNKGSEGNWNKFGLPTHVDVSFTIKELYHALTISNARDPKYDILNNIMLMDYIANMTGVNLNEIDIYRTISMYVMQRTVGYAKDTITLSLLGALDQSVTRAIGRTFGHGGRL